jgi:hypothetical protein
MHAMTTKTWLGLTLAAAMLPAAPALAQSPSVPPPDPASIWSLQGENASISTAHLADRDYTNGIRLGWTSAEGGVPGFLQGVGQTLWGDGRQRIAVDLTQQIYTPTNNTVAFPPLNDRPYAGVMMGTASLIHDNGSALSVLGLGLGVVGPAALGEQVQNGFHSLIGQTQTKGWDTQLHDEPLLQVNGQRTWRLPMGAFGGLETDALPELTAAVGNLRDYAQAGVTMRLGQGLDSDYGVARLLPGLTGTDVFRPTRLVAWYVFVGADAQAVAYDVTLQGNPWHDSRSVTIVPVVGELQAGLAVMFHGVRLTYTQVVQTQEYQHQKGGPHQFGSLAASVRF